MVHRHYLFQIWNQMGEVSFTQALSLDLKFNPMTSLTSLAFPKVPRKAS